MTEINRELAQRVLKVVDAGLVGSLGQPKPGFMCVEAAICYALGMPHGDDPKCILKSLRAFKIHLNDVKGWSSKAARAEGLRRLAIAQLGSDAIDEQQFVDRLADTARDWLRKAGETVGNAGLSYQQREMLSSARKYSGFIDGSTFPVTAGSWVAYTAHHLSRLLASLKIQPKDKTLSDCAEDVVQILVGMGAPGCQFLDLTEAA